VFRIVEVVEHVVQRARVLRMCLQDRLEDLARARLHLAARQPRRMSLMSIVVSDQAPGHVAQQGEGVERADVRIVAIQLV
jgi:hypothetical protein